MRLFGLFQHAGSPAWTLLAFISFCVTAAPLRAQRAADENEQHRILVGYFPQWGLYDRTPYTVKAFTSNGGAKIIDELNYAQGFVTNGHCSIADPNADLNYTFTSETSVDGTADSAAQPLRGNFHQLQELKQRYPHMKILISLMGRSSDFANDAQPENRAAFVASCVDLFLRGNLEAGISAPGLFDGIDLDWEYPRGDNGANYIALLQEFRSQMARVRPGLMLTAALGPSPRMYGDANINLIAGLLDRAGLMTYDFNGPWSDRTGFIAPLESASPDQGSVQRSVSSWLAAGMPAKKLLVGLPFYGYQWHDVPDVNHGFDQDGTPSRGDRPYRVIQTLIVKPSTAAPAVAPDLPTPQPPAAEKHPAATSSAPPPNQTNSARAAAGMAAEISSDAGGPVLYRDPVSKAPWLFDGDSFWTYEDPTSIRTKASYVAQQQLGGFMVWELSEDTADAALLNAAHTALTHPNPPPQDESAGIPRPTDRNTAQ